MNDKTNVITLHGRTGEKVRAIKVNKLDFAVIRPNDGNATIEIAGRLLTKDDLTILINHMENVEDGY